MTEVLQAVASNAAEKLGESITGVILENRELTFEVRREEILKVCRMLRERRVVAQHAVAQAQPPRAVARVPR
jgi:NADH:ubiquinone oxidoreductase subunit C